jgi:hypothetical protein
MVKFRLLSKSSLAAGALLVSGAVALPLVAMAGPTGFDATMRPVPHRAAADGGSQVRGEVDIFRDGNFVDVHVVATGLSPNLVHAMHIHGVGDSECPDKGDRNDRKADGLIDTTEGLPDYGPIRVSLTTEGDATPASGLAVTRFMVADENGRINYDRSFRIGDNFPLRIARNLAQMQVVIHGIDTNDNAAYDFSKGKSELDPSLPQEATVPASCGTIHH